MIVVAWIVAIGVVICFFGFIWKFLGWKEGAILLGILTVVLAVEFAGILSVAYIWEYYHPPKPASTNQVSRVHTNLPESP